MVKLRLARAGAKKKPFYRVIVADSRSPRDGRFIEQIGTYDPHKDPAEFKGEADRLDYWVKNGAEPSVTLHRLMVNKAKEAKPAS
jgi:small subunit ribosomal protein S16